MSGCALRRHEIDRPNWVSPRSFSLRGSPPERVDASEKRRLRKGALLFPMSLLNLNSPRNRCFRDALRLFVMAHGCNIIGKVYSACAFLEAARPGFWPLQKFDCTRALKVSPPARLRSRLRCRLTSRNAKALSLPLSAGTLRARRTFLLIKDTDFRGESRGMQRKKARDFAERTPSDTQ